MTYLERKKERVNHYKKYVEGWKLRKCGACNGSGYYDHNGSPKCGACEGTGKERYKDTVEVENAIKSLQEYLKEFSWLQSIGYAFCDYNYKIFIYTTKSTKSPIIDKLKEEGWKNFPIEFYIMGKMRLE